MAIRKRAQLISKLHAAHAFSLASAGQVQEMLNTSASQNVILLSCQDIAHVNQFISVTVQVFCLTSRTI